MREYGTPIYHYVEALYWLQAMKWWRERGLGSVPDHKESGYPWSCRTEFSDNVSKFQNG